MKSIFYHILFIFCSCFSISFFMNECLCLWGLQGADSQTSLGAEDYLVILTLAEKVADNAALWLVKSTKAADVDIVIVHGSKHASWHVPRLEYTGKFTHLKLFSASLNIPVDTRRSCRNPSVRCSQISSTTPLNVLWHNNESILSLCHIGALVREALWSGCSVVVLIKLDSVYWRHKFQVSQCAPHCA